MRDEQDVRNPDDDRIGHSDRGGGRRQHFIGCNHGGRLRRVCRFGRNLFYTGRRRYGAGASELRVATMKWILFAGALFASTSAFAQQGQDVQNNVITSLQAQRNNALDQAAVLNAQLQVANKELADLRAADAKLKDSLAAAQKQIGDVKKAPTPPEVPKEPK
jgi:hypothetical protein